MSVLVVQADSRMRYAVPRGLARAGLLEHLHTLALGDRGWGRLAAAWPRPWRPAAVRRLLGRRIDDIDPARVTAHFWLGLRVLWRERRARTPEAMARAHIASGHDLCRAALRAGLGRARVAGAVGVSSAPLLRAARAAGLRTFIEQIIAPPAVERAILDEERRLHPGWDPGEERQEPWYGQFEAAAREEWPLADLILCGSEFVREAIGRAGGPIERCVVVPYGAPAEQIAHPRPGFDGTRPLRVLTIGTVGLRKGAPYLLEAARALGGRAEFRWAGRIDLTPTAATQVVETIRLLGHVPRPELPELLAWADVFVLPSLCEGSAVACYEAMAAGLPVIATQNTGTMITDGRDGFLIPVRDPGAIAARLDFLRSNPHHCSRMSEQAQHTAREFTEERYGERVSRAIAGLLDA